MCTSGTSASPWSRACGWIEHGTQKLHLPYVAYAGRWAADGGSSPTIDRVCGRIGGVVWQTRWRASYADEGAVCEGLLHRNCRGTSTEQSDCFSGAQVPALARFSVGGGNPGTSDKSRSTRGLSLKLDLPDGAVWMQANLSAPVYFVKDPADFAPFVRSRVPDPVTGKPSPERLAAFNLAHPESLRQGKYLAERSAPASYVTTPYRA